MPAIRLYGRRWHFASDIVVVPAALSAVFHLCWVLAMGIGAAAAHSAWPQWSGCETSYLWFFAGMFAAMALHLILDILLMVSSLQGAPFEVSKRKAVVPLLYAWTLPLLAQLAFTALGLDLLYVDQPLDCWDPQDQHGVRHFVQALTYSTLAMLVLAFLGVVITYNLFEPHRSDPHFMAQQWQQRCSCIAGLLCCQQQVWHSSEGKRPPIHNMAELTAGLTAHVDLDATDIMAAVVLTSAAQNRRRRLRIAKALLPVAQALRSRLAQHSNSSTQQQGSSEGGHDEDSESDTSSLNDVPADRELQRALTAQAGALPPADALEVQGGAEDAGPRTPDTCQRSSKAVHWAASKADSAAQSRRQTQQQQQAGVPQQEVGQQQQRAGQQQLWQQQQEGDQPSAQQEESMEEAGNAGLTRENVELINRLSQLSEDAPEQVKVELAAQLVAGELVQEAPQHVPDQSLEIVEQLAAAIEQEVKELGGDTRLPQDAVVRLAKEDSLDPSALAERESTLWITSSGPVGSKQGSTAGSVAGRASSRGRVAPLTGSGSSMSGSAGLARDSVQALSAQTPFAAAGRSEGSGKSQAASEGHGEAVEAVSLAHASAVDKAAGVMLDAAAAGQQDGEEEPQEQEPPPATEEAAAAVGDVLARVAGRTGTSLSGSEAPQGRSRQLSLRRQLTVRFPVVITPSEQVDALRGPLPADALVEAIAGRFDRVPSSVLLEARHFLKYPYAVYSLQPSMERPPSIMDVACWKPPDPMQVIWKGLGELEELQARDDIEVLHLNASNRVLSHLPFALFLDHAKKAVVLAIRGTISIADLVTDMVVEPTPVSDWLPKDVQEQLGGQPAFAHAGMVAAAKAIFRDMRERGILQQLVEEEQPSSYTAPGSQQQGHDGQDDRESWHRGEGGAGDGQEGVDKQGGRVDQEPGRQVGELMRQKIEEEGWDFIVTGHSLGAGAAALVGLKLREEFPNLKVLAFACPGALASKNLAHAMASWCTTVACGKDAVPRGSVSNMARLFDEMVTALARCRVPKAKVLFRPWFARHSADPGLFYDYSEIPPEPLAFLSAYWESRGTLRTLPMYPPGRVLFLRPISRRRRSWQAVWVDPVDLISEGLLLSPKMLSDHLCSQNYEALTVAAESMGRVERGETEAEVVRRRVQQQRGRGRGRGARARGWWPGRHGRGVRMGQRQRQSSLQQVLVVAE